MYERKNDHLESTSNDIIIVIVVIDIIHGDMHEQSRMCSIIVLGSHVNMSIT
jgi:hypothetical protein